MWEYFIINIDEVLENYRALSKDNTKTVATFLSIEQKVEKILNTLVDLKPGKRFSLNIPIEVLVECFPTQYTNLEHIKDCLEKVNLQLYKRYDDITNDIFKNGYNSSKYDFLEYQNGKGKISINNPILQPYFNEYIKILNKQNYS